MTDISLLFLIIGVVIVLFVTEKVPVVLVALGTALALYFSGILTMGQALAGLGDSTTIFIASLFVVSAGLEVTGVSGDVASVPYQVIVSGHSGLTIELLLPDRMQRRFSTGEPVLIYALLTWMVNYIDRFIILRVM